MLGHLENAITPVKIIKWNSSKYSYLEDERQT